MDLTDPPPFRDHETPLFSPPPVMDAVNESVSPTLATVGPEMGVKASGGIRTYEDAVAMIKAGANRLGASAGIKIIAGPSGASSDHQCINCGACKTQCPTGACTIIKSSY